MLSSVCLSLALAAPAAASRGWSRGEWLDRASERGDHETGIGAIQTPMTHISPIGEVR
jgi:hypothetical protein